MRGKTSTLLRWKDKVKKSSLLSALLINIIIFIILQLVFKPIYETNDDNYISSIVYGSFGEYDTHLVYMNMLMGKIYKALLLYISPSIPWYAIIQCMLLFISFTVILYLFLLCHENVYRIIFCWMFMLVFGYECYVNVQYSKTAGVVATAGILLMYMAIKDEKIKKFFLVLGIALVLIASLYRFKVFCMMIPIIGSIVFVDCLKELFQKKYKFLLRCCIVFIPVFIVCLFGELYDMKQYENNQAWSEYREWDNLRIQLLDYGFPDYDKNRETYENLNISEMDLDLFTAWNYADTEVFTTDTMKKLIELKKEKTINLDLIRGFFTKDIFKMLQYSYFVILIVLYLTWWFAGRKNKLLVAISTIGCMILQFYFYYTDRFLINRVDMSIVMGMSIILILNIRKVRYINLKRSALVGALIGFSFVIFFQNTTKEEEKEKDLKQSESSEIFHLMSTDKDHLYLSENYTNNDLWTSAFQIWNMPAKGISTNYLSLGGWRYPTPIVKKILKNYNVKNPYRNMVNYGKVYLVCDYKYYTDEILNYIREHYSPKASIHLVKDINGHKFYKIRSKKIQLDKSKIDSNLSDIVSKVAVDENGKINGYMYKRGTNSFLQDVYIGVKENGKEKFYFTTQYEKSSKDNLNEGKYSWFSGKIPIKDIKMNKKTKISIYLKINNNLYEKRLK